MQTEYLLINKDEILDCVNNIKLEMEQKKCSKEFILLELKILEDLVANADKELFNAKDSLPKEFKGKTKRDIIYSYFEEFSKVFGYGYYDLINKLRKPVYVQRRQIFCYVIYKCLGGKTNGRIITTKDLGSFLGGQDHSSILHNIRCTIDKLECEDTEFISSIDLIIRTLKNKGLKISNIEIETKEYIANKKQVKYIDL